ncbi:hypothetical protein ACG3JG_07445 [Streptococcus parauberis]|nr:hypothetical protein [Streptococcus parauberis]
MPNYDGRTIQGLSTEWCVTPIIPMLSAIFEKTRILENLGQIDG